MKIEKEKRIVNIICADGSSIKGVAHINPGERVIDFMNDEKEKFIVITESEFFNTKCKKVSKVKRAVIINKSCIKSVEEI